MENRVPIKLDLNNFFAPAINDGPQDLSFLKPFFEEAHRGIKILKETGHLPYALLPTDTITLTAIQDAAQNYISIQNVIVLGIGGSALGLASCYQALYGSFAALKKSNSPRLFVLDNIDPQLIDDAFTFIKGQKNLFVLISKSGETAEVLAQYLHIKKIFPESKPNDFFIITDPHKGFLRQLAQEQKIPSLPIPPGVGGRFSIFTAVGLFPLAVCGIDIAEILVGAEHMELQCRSNHLEQNPAGLLACVSHYWLKQKNLSQVVMMPYSERLKLIPDWFAQLWAESLGKRFDLNHQEIFAGSTPMKSVGVTDQHSLMQLYLDGPRNKILFFIEVEHYQNSGALSTKTFGNTDIDYLSGKTLQDLLASEKQATEEALRESQRPNGSIKLSAINEYQLGQLYQLLMNVIPYEGVFYNINPFDQPAVQRIKEFTSGLMGKNGFEEFAQKLKRHPKKQDLIF